MNISPNLLISPFAFPNKQASPCALGDFALGSAHQIKPQIHIHVATNRIYRVEWFNPLPPQHLCPIKRGLPGGPRLGTPPKLLSFKEAGVVAGMLFIPIQGRIMVGHIATHDSGLFFFLLPPFSFLVLYPTCAVERQNVLQMTSSWQFVRPPIRLDPRPSSTSVPQKTSCSYYRLIFISPIHHFSSAAVAAFSRNVTHIQESGGWHVAWKTQQAQMRKTQLERVTAVDTAP